ncbi:MAG TPA: amino acid adenylation domain-containing protein [Noviherbaspirillum sp.]
MFSKQDIKDICPLTPMQRGMLHHALLEPESRSYHEQLILRIDGEVDAARLEAAWQAVIDAHDALRGRFLSERVSNPVQVIPFHEPVKLSVQRLGDTARTTGPDHLPAALEAYLAADLAQGFDLARAHPMRLALFADDDARHWMVWSFHHILLDGWSIGLVLEQLLAHYAGGPVAAPATGYLSYLRWLAGRDDKAALRHWADALAGFDGEGLVQATEAAPAHIRAVVDAATAERLRALAQAQRASLHHLLLCAWALTAGRHLDRTDVVVPTVLAGRPAEVEDADLLVGLMINTVPMRVTWRDGDSFTDLLQRVRDAGLEAARHQHVSMADIQSAAGRLPVDHVLLVQGMPHQQVIGNRFGTAPVGWAGFRESVPYALEVSLTPQEDGIGIALRGNRDPGWLQSLATTLQRLLCAVAAHPQRPLGELDLLDETVRARLLAWGDGGPAPEHGTILQAFDRQLERAPDATALICGSATLSYRELDRRANRLAHTLLASGPLAPDTTVALIARRDEGLLAGLLAILRAGAAYVPIDPGYPVDRVRLMLDASGCRHALVSASLVGQMPALPGIRVVTLEEAAPGAPTSPPDCAPSPDDLAYVIFTSGSTGTPKGAMLRHRNAAAFFASLPGMFGFGPGDRMLGVTTVSFDIAALELLGALSCGMTVVLASEEQARDPAQLIDFIAREQIDIVQMTPTRLKLLLDAAGSLSPLSGVRTLLVGGEALTGELAEKLLSFTHLQVFNVYGPTETTIWSTSWPLEHGPVSLGRAFPGEQLLVLSAQRRLQVPGAVGEIAIAGKGVGRGYLNDPAKTADRFVTLPGIDGPVYLTGDLGRWTADGRLEYLGRRDDQIKIRGMRIEIGDIEHHLRRLPGVRDAVAAVKQNTRGETELVAYLVGPSSDVAPAAYREALTLHLPSAMVPTHFLVLPELPQTPNGKTDRRALPDPQAGAQECASRAPSSVLEENLTRLFSEVLGRAIGPDEDFFLAGGHSLKAIQAIGRINRELGAGYTLRDLYRAPSAAALSAVATVATAPIMRAPEAPDYPLSCTQQALWILDQMQPGYAGYNVPGAYLLHGTLDIDAFRRAWQALAMRHESLRTVFRMVNGQPRQVVLESIDIDIEHATPGALPLDRHIADITCRPFDLRSGPLVRIVLIPVDAQRQVLVLVTHHIIGDGWSDALLARDLALAYRSARAGHEAGDALPTAPAIRYRDFAVWQQRYLATPRARTHREYWQRRLDKPPQLALPTDGPRGNALSRRGARVELCLHRAASEAWLAATPPALRYATLAAATLALLHLESGQTDLLLGLPIANRDRAELQEQVGLHLNMLPLRARLRRENNLQHLRDTCATDILEAMAHADYPFARLVDELGLTAAPGRHPVFDAMLIYHQHPAPELQLDGVTATLHDPRSYTSRFDLDVEIWTSGGEVRGFIEYDTGLFTAERAQGFADKWQALLTAFGTRPAATLDEVCREIVPRSDDAAAFVMKSMALDEEF